MPTYEYACRDCGEHLEVVQSFKDDPLTECGKCGGALRKVFGAAGIIFKGSGYYVTDSRPKPAKKKADKTESTSGKKDTSTPASSDSGSSSSSTTASSDSGSSSSSTTAESA